MVMLLVALNEFYTTFNKKTLLKTMMKRYFNAMLIKIKLNGHKVVSELH